MQYGVWTPYQRRRSTAPRHDVCPHRYPSPRPRSINICLETVAAMADETDHLLGGDCRQESSLEGDVWRLVSIDPLVVCADPRFGDPKCLFDL